MARRRRTPAARRRAGAARPVRLARAGAGGDRGGQGARGWRDREQAGAGGRRGRRDIEAEAAHPWVSRGGVKLAHALDVFGVDPAGRACLDVGASTGGFTDVLLARGARRVVAVDVGRGQLHPKLQSDSRVVVAGGDRCARADPGNDWRAAQRSSSAMRASSAWRRCCRGRSAWRRQRRCWSALFKPQFEVGPAHVGKGGIVSDECRCRCSCGRTLEAWLGSEGWRVTAGRRSPIAGRRRQRRALVLRSQNY